MTKVKERQIKKIVGLIVRKYTGRPTEYSKQSN